METNLFIERLSSFPESTSVLIQDSFDIFPVFSVHNRADIYYLEAGWAPLMSLPKGTQQECLKVGQILDEVKLISSCESIFCQIQGNKQTIHSILPGFQILSVSKVQCIIKTFC